MLGDPISIGSPKDNLYANAWQWFCDEAGEKLYKVVDGQWRQYNSVRARQRTRNRVQHFKTYGIVEYPDDAASLFRTSVSITGTIVVSEGYAAVLDKEPEGEVDHPSRLKLQGELDNRAGEQWASMGVVMTAEIDEIVRDIELGTAVGVSDGSFKDEFGTASWVLENASGSQRMMGNVLIPPAS